MAELALEERKGRARPQDEMSVEVGMGEGETVAVAEFALEERKGGEC